MQPTIAKFFRETNSLGKYTGSVLSPYHHLDITLTSYDVTLPGQYPS
jgi:hypothetical protein